MLIITIQDLIAIMYGGAVTLVVGFIVGFIAASWFVKKAEAKHVYMIKGMYDSFSKIEDEINACRNKEQLRDAYLSIFAFEALYSDSASFTSELYEMYLVKQEQITKGIRESQPIDSQYRFYVFLGYMPVSIWMCRHYLKSSLIKIINGG